jgi:hypothetical protein
VINHVAKNKIEVSFIVLKRGRWISVY